MLGSRRRRPPNPPLTAMTANPNATMAAAAVFGRRDSQQSLSSAAAAAALRARPATPTNVADVQTKRTMRRSASVSSAGTAPETTGRRPSLHRRGSSASMSEKTFRSPSPHRPPGAKTSSPGFGRGDDPPPLPALPENIGKGDDGANGAARQRQSQHRKANSLGIGTTPVRLASQRLGKEGSPSWFGAAQVGDMKSVRTSDAAMAAPPRQELDEERPSSRASSINFSYPVRARVGSPPVSPVETDFPDFPFLSSDTQHKRTSSRSSSTRNRPVSVGATPSLVYDPNSRRMVPATTEKPSKKYKDTPPKGRAHQAQGAVGRTQVAPVESGSNVKPQQVPTSTRAQHTTTPQSTQEPDYYHEEEPSVKAIISSPRLDAKRIGQQRAQEVPTVSNLPEADGNAISLPTDTAQVGQPLRRQPSVVREESEPEDGESGLTSQHTVNDALDAVPSEGAPPGLATARQDTSFLCDPRATSDIRRDRAHSNSPVRTAHFGIIQDSPEIRHSPPPRSVSPRKPALKQCSPSRELSPDGNTSEASGSVNAGEELAVPRKKSFRVSFNDANNVVVGPSASSNQTEPPTNAASSQAGPSRRPWYSNIARGKKKDTVPLDDEVMKPRPALPSFGSVRDKKSRETTSGEEERPLVRPPEPRPETNPTGVSSDSAIGTVLQQDADQISRNTANISKFREPLPPVVTSVEGGGYISDSSSESEQERDMSPVAESSTGIQEGPPAVVGLPLAAVGEIAPNGSALPTESVDDGGATTSEADSKDAEAIPAITISQPTPPQAKTPPEAFFDIPGGFPKEESEISAPEAGRRSTSSSSVEPARQVTPDPAVQQVAPQTPVTVPATDLPDDEDTDDSESSIYSDAYEDLSDMEDGGFLSLDAVVESPISWNGAKQTRSQEAPRRSPVPTSNEPQTPQTPERKPYGSLPPLAPDLSSASTVVETHPPERPHDDWERAKIFWRSLTAEKRAQLEREAREDAGTEGDHETSPQAPQKTKKKKSVNRKNAERKALAVHMAQKMMAEQQDQRQRVDNAERADRTYMIKPGTKVGNDGRTTVTRDVPTMRKSMRGDGSVPKSRSRDEGKQAAKGHARQTSELSSSAASAAGAKTSFLPNTPRRHGSGSSESSFRRSPLGQNNAGFGLRKTMRQSSPPAGHNEPTSRTPSKRFSLRSLSPAGFGRASPAPASSGMRQTLRASSQQEAKPSTASRIAHFGRGSGKGGASGKSKKLRGSKSSSRFGDSSGDDDDNAAPSMARFRSRFDDSSDEDDFTPRASSRPASLPMAKSAHTLFEPNQAIAEASPALPEEEEDDDEEELSDVETRVAPSTRPDDGGLRRSRSGRGELMVGSQTAPSMMTSTGSQLAAGGGSGRSKKRNSLMSVLRRKKHNTGGIQRAEIMDSAARRDTPLERGAYELRGMKRGDGEDDDDHDQEPGRQVQPRSPRLRKRTVSLGHDVGAAWPFPGEAVAGDGAGPSGNLGTRMLNGRPSTADGGVPGVDGGSIKKKRFGALRRVFRLPEY